uniref:Leuk-A4-hydro_C domain-containing protein n=1 Tax=Panagrellus redivivus TaxID=6233 RepID=A0A7E4V8B2_PANRE
MTDTLTDVSSVSNYSEVKVTHFDLDLNVDFGLKRLKGSVILRLVGVRPTSQVVLDIRGLEIHSAFASEEDVPFKIEDHGPLGQSLTLSIEPLDVGERRDIEVIYSTRNASALQFVEKELTSDKVQPFLYSQCQAIHARSIVPCMDTPAVKQTYAARVQVPKGITLLMSAISYGKEEEGNPKVAIWKEDTQYKEEFSQHKSTVDEGHDVFLFKQPMPIPSYLLAIVAGHLEKRDISERCAVWAEPSMVDKAHYEFADTEVMLTTAEELVGPYQWGRYDLIVLPPFFPFGGMENPCLTFVTPTIIAGDRSLTNVIAHEIAHSWTGNLVTNYNWEHFWLNEGFTVFLERKIMGRIYGESLRQFENICGWEDRLLPTIKETFGCTHEFTKLIPNLQGCDPDDAFSTVPYEKGSALLLVLEQKLDDVPRFEKFLKDYIDEYAGKSIVTQIWKSFLYEQFADKKDVLDSIDWNAWLNNAGVPPDTPVFDHSHLKDCRKIAETWQNASDAEIDALDVKQFDELTSVMKVKVLDCIESSEQLIDRERFKRIVKKYKLSETGNCEVLFSFILIALKTKNTEMVPFIINFVLQQGRLNFYKEILLFSKLFDWDFTRDLAISEFRKNIPKMHPITVQVVESLLAKK